MLTEHEIRNVILIGKSLLNTKKALEVVEPLNNQFHINRLKNRIRKNEIELKSIIEKI
jgi:hypothetical protein